MMMANPASCSLARRAAPPPMHTIIESTEGSAYYRGPRAVCMSKQRGRQPLGPAALERWGAVAARRFSESLFSVDPSIHSKTTTMPPHLTLSPNARTTQAGRQAGRHHDHCLLHTARWRRRQRLPSFLLPVHPAAKANKAPGCNSRGRSRRRRASSSKGRRWSDALARTHDRRRGPPHPARQPVRQSWSSRSSHQQGEKTPPRSCWRGPRRWAHSTSSTARRSSSRSRAVVVAAAAAAAAAGGEGEGAPRSRTGGRTPMRRRRPLWRPRGQPGAAVSAAAAA